MLDRVNKICKDFSHANGAFNCQSARMHVDVSDLMIELRAIEQGADADLEQFGTIVENLLGHINGMNDCVTSMTTAFAALVKEGMKDD